MVSPITDRSERPSYALVLERLDGGEVVPVELGSQVEEIVGEKGQTLSGEFQCDSIVLVLDVGLVDRVSLVDCLYLVVPTCDKGSSFATRYMFEPEGEARVAQSAAKWLGIQHADKHLRSAESVRSLISDRPYLRSRTGSVSGGRKQITIEVSALINWVSNYQVRAV